MTEEQKQRLAELRFKFFDPKQKDPISKEEIYEKVVLEDLEKESKSQRRVSQPN